VACRGEGRRATATAITQVIWNKALRVFLWTGVGVRLWVRRSCFLYHSESVKVFVLTLYFFTICRYSSLYHQIKWTGNEFSINLWVQDDGGDSLTWRGKWIKGRLLNAAYSFFLYVPPPSPNPIVYTQLEACWARSSFYVQVEPFYLNCTLFTNRIKGTRWTFRCLSWPRLIS
jgi:hypothetical protein